MKKWVIITIACCILCCMDACADQNRKEAVTTQACIEQVTATETATASSLARQNETEDENVEEKNRTMIAQALDISEDSRNIRFILASLDTIQAGCLQSAKEVKENGETSLEILAEDGVSYRIYLSGSGSVDAVENLVTGEWPIQSQR